jgi:glycoprotein-N-acetylgalactosamine 3-beta-galactosyltransferase
MSRNDGRPSSRSLIAKVLACFLTMWLVALLFAQSAVEKLLTETTPDVVPAALPRIQHRSGGDPSPPGSLERDSRVDTARSMKDEDDPWFGWQPVTTTDDPVCSVRKCFQAKRPGPQKCSICRDDPSDFNSIPVVRGDWVPDPSMLRRMFLKGRDASGNAWPPPLSKEFCEPIGVDGGAASDQNKELLDQVPIIGVDPLEPGPTIFCGIYTMEQNHPTNVRAMRETWAPHCDGFVAFSTRSDPRIPALGIEHEGREEYNNMWQKSRSIWQFIGKHYLRDFDYFILGGEDLFVITGNLRRYLKSLSVSPDDDLFAGRRFKGRGNDNYFNSGGAGYVLSRGTLRKFYDTGWDNPACHAREHTPMEDVMMADCLRKAFNIGLTDTRDSLGRERFHPFAPGTHLTWRSPLHGETDWYADYNEEWGVKLGPLCCAPDSVSFHYIKKPAMVRHLFSLLYACPMSRPPADKP